MTHLVVLSGGLDSTVALAQALHYANRFDTGPVKAVSFNYGQRHAKELDQARTIADHYGIDHQVVALPSLTHTTSALTGGDVDVPDGHYAEESMKATVVPGRNLLFASTAITLCEPGDFVWFGVHAGDHPIYPDCRPDFWNRLTNLTVDAYEIQIVTPWLTAEKTHIAQEGHNLGAPMGLTWSCYKGGDTHCGRCGTCVERAEAFHLAGVPDPTEYADPTFWRATVGA